MLKDLKEQVLIENLNLQKFGLVLYTWGNVSAVDRGKGVVAIKPSGVPYEELKTDDIVVVDLENGQTVEGNLKPSSDLPTHLELYRAFREIGGVVHTHSMYATSFAQAGRGIPPLGTTHADYFYGEIPCSRGLTRDEIAAEYEKNTGRVMVAQLKQNEVTGENALAVPSILVRQHGPFNWGKDAKEAVHNAVVCEQLAKMAIHTMLLCPEVDWLNPHLLDKHFLRKHGESAYYGQS